MPLRLTASYDRVFAAAVLAVIAVFSLVVLPSFAASSNREIDTLFQELKEAGSEFEARQTENLIWQHWFAAAPDEETASLVDRAMERRRSYDFAGAKELLDKAVARAPDYSEVWNQRAFVLFLQGKLDRSLEDIDRALELEPRHFGALAGKARILMRQGRVQLGQKALRQAVEIYPFLRERSLLLPEPKGIDL